MNIKLKNMQSYLQLWREKTDSFLLMAKERFDREQSVIGIDVGTSSVKVVQMADVDGAMTIIKSAMVDVGGFSGSHEDVLAALKTALAGIETKGARVVAMVNCPETCTRKIVIPNMPKKEIAEAVRWEAKSSIPFSIEEALMDFEILGEESERGVKKLIIAVAATPKETVDKLLSLFFKAGIEVSAMIPISVGLQNLIALSIMKREATIAVVEMGASVTELNIYRGGQMAFSRKLPIAGNDITKSMTSALMSAQGKVELSMEEAEKTKKEQGIPSGKETELVEGKILPSQILSLVRPCAEHLAGEIERSLDFYREESRGGRVSKIVLFGGGASLKGLSEFLYNELEIEIEIGDAFEHIKALEDTVKDEKKTGSRFNLAVGAVLNKAGKINLAPIEVKEKTKRFIENVSFEIIAVVVIVSALLLYAGMRVKLHGFGQKMAAARLEERALTPQLEKLRADMVINDILKDEPYWEDVFKEISNVIPSRIYLTNMDMEEGVVRLEGDILQGDQDTQAVLSQFMLTLEEGIFQDVSLVTAQKREGPLNVSEFEITCRVE